MKKEITLLTKNDTDWETIIPNVTIRKVGNIVEICFVNYDVITSSSWQTQFQIKKLYRPTKTVYTSICANEAKASNIMVSISENGIVQFFKEDINPKKALGLIMYFI